MNLTGIISISGKPGLYKVVAQAKNSVIVESLEDNKRVPAYATDRISALEDISIYTYGEDKPLKEIYTDIFNKENGGATLSHKDDIKKLTAYLTEILPDYDQERVYSSDIKKLFQWYNLLHKSGNLKLEEEVAEEVTEETEKTAEKAEKKEKKAATAKKPAAAKKPVAAAKPAKSAKPAGAAKAKTTVQRKSGSN
ncbi:MAG: DUF5606 domain-containing protein [Crocinitomicaceae bacterium]|nr:DUF5606 domain-containing protein [Crocinitomicaceae bacterium]